MKGRISAQLEDESEEVKRYRQVWMITEEDCEDRRNFDQCFAALLEVLTEPRFR